MSPGVAEVFNRTAWRFGVIVGLRFQFFAPLWENKNFRLVKFPIFELLPTILLTKSPYFPIQPIFLRKPLSLPLLKNELPEMSFMA